MDKQFELFLEECVSSFGEEYIEVPEEMQIPHKFSRPFRKKMRKLMRQQSSSFSIAKVPHKRRLSMIIALTILIFLSLVTAVICGGRNLFSNFFTEVFSDKFLVWNNPQEDSLRRIEEIYLPTWLPEGYELVNTCIAPDRSQYIYYYCNNPDCDHESDSYHLCFEQKIKENYIVNINNGINDLVQIAVNDYSGIEYIGSSYHIIWNNDKYTFEVHGSVNLNKNHALDIAESVEKVE